MSELQELTIAISGEITSSNFPEWKKTLLAVVKSSARELVTDDDFAQAETDVKSLKAGEATLLAAKDKALQQAAKINQLFADIDEVSEEARAARLLLSSQIKTRKDEIKRAIIDSAQADIVALVSEQHEIFRQQLGKSITADAARQLESCTKGKRTTATLKAAVDDATKVWVDFIVSTNGMIEANIDLIDAHSAKYAAILQDRAQLAVLQPGDLKAAIAARIELFNKEQDEARKAQEAQENELQLRREMAEKAKAEKAATVTDQADVTAEELPTAASPEQDSPGRRQAAIVRPNAPAATTTTPGTDAYQITIVATCTADGAKSLARALKDNYGEHFDEIRMFKKSATVA